MEETVKEEPKNCETQEVAEVKAEPKKRGRKKKDDKPTVTDEDLAEFMAWKKQKAEAAKVVCDAPDDDKVYRMWKEESQLVKGIFRMHEPAGGMVRFPFRKYKWDQVQWYTMQDGETYEVPLAVARHLNQNCSYAVHSHILDGQGNPTVNMNKMKSRMNFESTEFAVA